MTLLSFPSASSGAKDHVGDDPEVYCDLKCLQFLKTGSHILTRLTLNSLASPGWPQTPGDPLA